MKVIGKMYIKHDNTRKGYEIVERKGIRFMKVGNELIGLSLLNREMFDIYYDIKETNKLKKKIKECNFNIEEGEKDEKI